MISPKGALPIASNNLLLVLASESPRRKALLAQVGIIPDAVVPANIDETPYRQWTPAYNAFYFAAAKAARVAVLWDGAPAIFLAADTVVAAGRRILPKAEDPATARACLTLLSGRQHKVITAVALAAPGEKVKHRVVQTRVAFRRLTPREIDAYVESREGEGKAGGYAIQGRAEMFVRHINGSYSNVVGLPLAETVQLLRGCGYGG